MIPTSWMNWTPFRVAVGALAIALITGAVAFAQALRISDVSTRAVTALPTPASLAPPATRKPLDLDAVIERDVFAPDRAAPSNEYLLPSEMVEETPVAALPRVLVLGIALADGGRSFATCQVGTDRATIVRVGDKLGPFVVKSIESKKVIFTSPGGAPLVVNALTSGSGN